MLPKYSSTVNDTKKPPKSKFMQTVATRNKLNFYNISFISSTKMFCIIQYRPAYLSEGKCHCANSKQEIVSFTLFVSHSHNFTNMPKML